jgi:hypothetical protein
MSDFLGKSDAILGFIKGRPEAGTAFAKSESALQVFACLFEQLTFLIGVISC